MWNSDGVLSLRGVRFTKFRLNKASTPTVRSHTNDLSSALTAGAGSINRKIRAYPRDIEIFSDLLKARLIIIGPCACGEFLIWILMLPRPEESRVLTEANFVPYKFAYPTRAFSRKKKVNFPEILRSFFSNHYFSSNLPRFRADTNDTFYLASRKLCATLSVHFLPSSLTSALSLWK